MIYFEPESTLPASRLEMGDKYDNSVVYMLSTLPSEVFLVEHKNGSWAVTTGTVVGAESEGPIVVKSDKKPKSKK